jgi:dTDP-4-amino-4,6-dideoxygalactose transaminase
LGEALHGTGLALPAEPGEGEDHVYHHFVVEHADRDALRERLADDGIASDVDYPIAIHRSRAYAHLLNGYDPAPVATNLAARICSLPIHPNLDAAAADRISAAVAGAALVLGGA